MFRRDSFVEYITRGLLAEQALWRGDTATAVDEVQATVRVMKAFGDGEVGPEAIRVAAVGLSALADQAVAARAGGDAVTVARAVAQATELIEIARTGAAYRKARGLRWASTAGAGWPGPKRNGAGLTG